MRPLSVWCSALLIIFCCSALFVLSGCGGFVVNAVDSGALKASHNAVSFGDVLVNTPATQSITLTSTGTVPVTITGATLTGSGFALPGAVFPATLSPGQEETLNVEFNPATVGAATGQLTIASNSSNDSPAVISLSGMGTAASSFANISIGATPGRAISSTFMGLSHEWGTAQAMMGDSNAGINNAYRQLLQNLMAYGSGPIILRIGGSSTDLSGEPTSTTAQPFADLASALGAHFYLGVNLGSDNVNLAMDQAKAFVSQMPAGSLDAIEIGNEPDKYASNGMRSSPYAYQDYLADFNTWKTNITPLLPSGTKLMGASWASTGMLSNIKSYDSAEAAALTTFSEHYYVGSGAATNADDILLTPGSATSGPNAVAAAVTTTHQYGLPFRMGEINSLSDGGGIGISNAFESALWAVDNMFEYVNAGVDGVNWEVGMSAFNAYNPFSITTTTSSGTNSYVVTVHPLYYGLLFFQSATGNSAHLLPVTLSTQANLTAWATVDSSGTPRLVIINKDENLTGTANVTLSGYTQAQIFRLSAPTYQSKSGVTFAGQTFDGSTNGTIQGTQAIETVGLSNGIFQIPMPITSAALVVFTK